MATSANPTANGLIGIIVRNGARALSAYEILTARVSVDLAARAFHAKLIN
jgi:hypothetical protein